jgi:hypothetical protein
MNSNNWLSFPLSPTHPSLPAHLHASHPHQFSLGLVNDNMENPFQTQGTSLIISSFFFFWDNYKYRIPYSLFLCLLPFRVESS